MARPIYVTNTSAATSRVVNLDMNQSPFNVTVAVTASSSGTFAGGVEITYDDQQYLTSIGSTRSPVWSFSTAISSATAANAWTALTSPVAGIRLTTTAQSSCLVTMCVIQGGPG